VKFVRTKKMLSSQCFGTRAVKTLRGATQIRDRDLLTKALQRQRRIMLLSAGPQRSPLASCYGEVTVGVSAPAPPLSFVRAERDTFSGVSLSVDRLIGVLLRHHSGIFAMIVCGF